MSLDGTKTNLILTLLLVLMSHTGLCAQSSSKNYVQTKTYLNDAGTSFLRHIDYYDELGCVAETVDVGGNTTQTPIVVRTDYTTQMKPFKQWAPVPATSLDYLDSVTVDVDSEERHGDWPAFSRNEYDDFQELAKSWKPGNAWQGKPVTVNRSVVPKGKVKKYYVNADGSLSAAGTYPYGLLTSATTTDEDGRSITVYTDFHGNTVLERRGADNDTYYVYDGYGRLSYVLPPMCQDPRCSTSDMQKYWYKYTYDDRGRCTEKQLPGCEPVKYWYDEANRLQAEQDGHLREQSQYRRYCYDAIGRLTLQSIHSINTPRDAAAESNAVAVEVKNYYDDYSCRQELTQLFPVWADSINAAYNSPAVSRGRLTATLCSTSNTKKHFEMYRYDAKGRMAYKLIAYSDKWMKAVHTAYNFVGDVVSVAENVYTHNDHGGKVVLAKRRTVNTYHPGTRLLEKTTVTHTDKNGNTSTQVVSRTAYDDFGNVTANDRPGTAADMNYDFDTLHGWLKGVSSPCGFSEQLLRETAEDAQLSGNIGSMLWRNAVGGEQHRYDYTYDGLGWLTDARYSSSASGMSERFDESVTYNANGSITSLRRNGMRNDGTFGLIDDLAVSYDGNRLLKVTDGAEALNYNGALDFNDGDDAACEYQYDSDGSLTYDGNRGISSVAYDNGHHPCTIRKSDGKSRTVNDYTPDGRKLSSQHVAYIAKAGGTNSRVSTTDTYIDGLILRGGKPLMWLFDGGYVALDDNGTPTSWNYYVADHLGSTRMVVGSDGTVKETVSYYPFGGEMRMQPPAQATGDLQHPFRFTGKELDRLNGLNWYDFGARWYDVAGVPMWTSIDPLCEKDYPTSPYVYCGNNPVNRIDKDGRIWDTVFDVACLVYDVAEAGYQYCTTGSVSSTTKAALGADALAAIVPGLTGTGLAVRAGAKAASKSIDVAKGAEKALQSTTKIVAKTNRAESIAKGIPETELGPSGLPKIHNVVKPNLKSAKDAATNSRKANTQPVKHSSDKGQKEHFHSTRNGEKLKGKDNIHYVNNSSKKNPE